jgi:hypothetical protein
MSPMLFPLLVAVSAPSFDAEPVPLFVARANEELRAKAAFHSATWHLDEAAWSVDLDAGTITFTAADGVVARAPVQVVGTFDAAAGTFLWGWDHPSVPPARRAHAEAARRWGERHGLAEYTTRLVEATEARAWEYAAVAMRLAGAQGAYRCPTGSALVFVTFGDVSLANPEPRVTPGTPTPR